MGIFSVGIAILMPLVIANVRTNDGAAVRSKAVSLAQSRSEELRTLEYAEIRALAAAPPAAQRVDGTYTVELDFPEVPSLDGDEDDLTRVLVRVRWDLGGRGAGAVFFLTARARY